MDKPALFCEQCGARLPLKARFCEQCGAAAAGADPFTHPSQPTPKAADPHPIPPSASLEWIIGHVPVDHITNDRRGRVVQREGEMLITSQRLLYLHNGFWKDDERWFSIQSEWEQALGGELGEVPMDKWRAVADAYDFAGPDWKALYACALDDLLRESQHNFALPLEMIVAADVTLDDEEQDRLNLLLEDNSRRQFMLYLALGRPCYHFLAEALGPARVTLAAAGR